jgi:hypothetical protein
VIEPRNRINHQYVQQQGVLMKKLFLVTTTILSMSAFAGADFTYIDGIQTDQATKAVTHVNLFDFKTDLTKNLAGDVMIINKSSNTNLVTNRTELGLTAKQAIVGPVDLYARGSLGYKQASGSNGLSYYTIEPGVKVTLPANLDLRVGYYYRNAIQNSYLDKTSEMRYAVNYNLTKKDKISVGYFHSLSGNVALANTKFVGYTHSF